MRVRLLAALVVLGMALAGCGDEPKGDADGDGIPDYDEGLGFTVLIRFADHAENRTVTSDPQDPDTDDDGLPDRYEFILNADPRDPDTDDDGLTDCQEAVTRSLGQCQAGGDEEGDGGYATRVNDADSDGGQGRYVRTLPFTDERGVAGLRPSGDGLTDGEEVAGFDVVVGGRIERVATDPLKSDSDADGLDDGEEVRLYSASPRLTDTDGDGCVDGADAWPDTVERYDLGLREVGWKGSEPARLRITGLVADSKVPGPGGDAGFVVAGTAAGEEVRTPAVRPAACAFPPHDPWTQVYVLVDVEQSGRWTSTGLARANPDGQNHLWWNVRDGTLAWQKGGAALASPAVWENEQVRVEFAPRAQIHGP